MIDAGTEDPIEAMIEESALVVAVEPGFAWVETRRRSACTSCAVSSHCGTSAISKLFGARVSRLRVRDGIGVEVGDRVVIGLAEGALTRASLLAYLVPLIALMLVASAARTAGVGEGLSALAGLLGLCLGLWASGRLTGGAVGRRGYRPLLLRRVSSTS
jgi:sigma-E factor negative regulatory protein RseC